MRRFWLLLCLLSVPVTAWSRYEPRTLIRPQAEKRTDVVVVLSTHTQMAEEIGNTGVNSGSDCSIKGSLVQACGDKLCSGTESVASCPIDCTTDDWADNSPGSAPKCANTSSATSQMAAVKDALRETLMDVKGYGNFSLVTFDQAPYYRYIKEYRQVCGLSGCTPAEEPDVEKTVLFSHLELSTDSSWTGGTTSGAWDSSGNRPGTSFAPAGVTYELVSSSAAVATGGVKKLDSLYRRENSSGFVYKRFDFNGVDFADLDGNWEYVGSYYVYTAKDLRDFVTCATSATYLGPAYQNGTDICYLRNHSQDVSPQGFTAGSGASTRASLSTETVETNAASFDANQLNTLYLLNAAEAGGLHAHGSVRDVGAGLTQAGTELGARQAAADPMGACRRRVVILISDGADANADAQATALYDLFGTNKTEIYVIALANVAAGELAHLDSIADIGDNGALDNSAFALIGSDTLAIRDEIRSILQTALFGAYTTAPSGVATSANAPISNNVALIPVTTIPGAARPARGQLQAVDVLTNTLLWDAGQKLTIPISGWKSRQLFTAFLNATPVRLLLNDNSGNVNLAPMKTVWQDVTGSAFPGSDAEFTKFIQWVAGESRRWRMGPLFDNTPATVGPPPRQPFIGQAFPHSTFEQAQAQRQNLVYQATNDGILHAFSLETGDEMFGWVPAHLLPKLYSLFQKGGQDWDLNNWEYVLTGSVKVEDVLKLTNPSPPTYAWRTWLTITDGLGGDQWVILDITDPTDADCSSSPCTYTFPATPRIALVADSEHPAFDTLNLHDRMGLTLSEPSIAYDYQNIGTSVEPLPFIGMASGYDPNPLVAPANEGDWYFTFTSVVPPGINFAPYEMADPTSPDGVEYAAMADNIAVVDIPNGLDMIASYQADLDGRLWRFRNGIFGSGDVTKQINHNPVQPIYHGPAITKLVNSDHEVIAVASRSFQEETVPSTALWTGQDAHLRMLSNLAGIPSSPLYEFDVEVDDVCSLPFIGSGVCTNPPSNALPVARPLLTVDANNPTIVDAFYLLQAPATTACVGDQINVGTGYLVRVRSDGATTSVASTQSFANTIVSGLTLMGNQSEIVVTQSQIGSLSASANLTVNASGLRAAYGMPGVERIVQVNDNKPF